MLVRWWLLELLYKRVMNAMQTQRKTNSPLKMVGGSRGEIVYSLQVRVRRSGVATPRGGDMLAATTPALAHFPHQGFVTCPPGICNGVSLF